MNGKMLEKIIRSCRRELEDATRRVRRVTSWRELDRLEEFINNRRYKLDKLQVIKSRMKTVKKAKVTKKAVKAVKKVVKASKKAKK